MFLIILSFVFTVKLYHHTRLANTIMINPRIYIFLKIIIYFLSRYPEFILGKLLLRLLLKYKSNNIALHLKNNCIIYLYIVLIRFSISLLNIFCGNRKNQFS